VQDTKPDATGSKERIVDVTTFVPPTAVRVRLANGKTYPLVSWVDLPTELALEGLANELADRREPDDQVGMIQRARRTVRLLCPTMPDEDLHALTTRQLFATAKAFYDMSREGEEGNPPVAGSNSASVSSSPAPPDSTAGVTAS
jgi:hypothetical protein